MENLKYPFPNQKKNEPGIKSIFIAKLVVVENF